MSAAEQYEGLEATGANLRRILGEEGARRRHSGRCDEGAIELAGALGRAAAEVRAALAAELADELAGGIEASDREV